MNDDYEMTNIVWILFPPSEARRESRTYPPSPHSFQNIRTIQTESFGSFLSFQIQELDILLTMIQSSYPFLILISFIYLFSKPKATKIGLTKSSIEAKQERKSKQTSERGL